MSSPSPVSMSKAASEAPRFRLGLTFAAYAVVVLIAAVSIPLRIPEVLQIAAIRGFSFGRFFSWIAQGPGSAPLYPGLQIPFVMLGGHSRLGARLLSVVFALAACYLFLQLARRIPIARPYWALLVFMLLPVHFELCFEAEPFEQALLLVVVGTDCFFRLLSRPQVKTALLYAGCLTLCLYTDRYSFLPAIGYLLFLLRFVNRAHERRAMWYCLAATALPVLLFVPYALWAHTQVNPDWLAEAPSTASGAVYMRAVRSAAVEPWAAYLLSIVLTIGLVLGFSTSFRVATGSIAKRIRLFTMSGGAAAAIAIALLLDVWLGQRFLPSHLLWTLPALVILLFAGVERAAKQPAWRALVFPAVLILLVASLAADAQYVLWPSGSAPRENLAAVAASVPTQLRGDSCVVFVSERFSRALFLVFEPQLEHRECLDFFHSRIVLASHPYVTVDQQHDAESFFRGLNFEETHRESSGGGEIVVMQQHSK